MTTKTTLAIHRILLGAMTVFAYLSVCLPALKLGGTLAVKTLNLIDSAVVFNKAEKERWKEWLSLAFKVTVVVLAVVGVILASIPLFIAGFAVDIASQLKNIYIHASEKNVWKVALDFGLLLIDTLALAAIITGGWQLAVAAASLGGVLMSIVTIYTFAQAYVHKDGGAFFEAFCYGALTALGFMVAHQCAQVSEKTATVEVKNETDQPQDVTGSDGKVAELAPGETRTIVVPRGDANTVVIGHHAESYNQKVCDKGFSVVYNSGNESYDLVKDCHYEPRIRIVQDTAPTLSVGNQKFVGFDSSTVTHPGTIAPILNNFPTIDAPLAQAMNIKIKRPSLNPVNI